MQGEIFIKHGKIIDFIQNQGFVKIISDENVMEFDNAFAYSRFTDHHGHITGFGKTLSMVNFSDCKSAEECCEMAKRSNQVFHDWMIGYGWNHENWQTKELPDKKILDAFFPDTPVYFLRIDGHTAWVNTKALNLASIGSNTMNPVGGEILIDKSGKATGILIDNAMDLVKVLIPEQTENDIKSFIIKAIEKLLHYGISEVDDMDVEPSYLKCFEELDSEGKLTIKVNSYVKAQNEDYLASKIIPQKFKNYEIKGVKFYADGALGSYGAALINPYSDNKSKSGLLLISNDELFTRAKKALDLGFEIATHAIGDLANRLVIDVYSKLLETAIDSNPILRIEHAQIVHPEDLKKIVKLASKGYKIFASVQPVHCVSDAVMARKRLGRRTSYSYPWKSLRDSGADLMFGSDFPIESPNPILGVDALLNRIPLNEKKSWYGKEKLLIEDALKGYNSNLKSEKESSFKNNPANITILDKNLYDLNEEEIKKVKVKSVFVNGKQVFRT